MAIEAKAATASQERRRERWSREQRLREENY